MKEVKLPRLIVVAGPTASGKTSLGIELALKFNGEIISADSRQVFRGLDVGSGKVKKDEMRGIPHHLVDILDPGEKYSAYRFQKDCNKLIKEITSRGKLPIIVGGTGLYIESVVEQYKFSKLSKKARRGRTKKRGLRPSTLVLDLQPPREQTKTNIETRLIKRWRNEGMLQEVEGLIASGVSKPWLKSLGLEYRYITKYLEDDGEFSNAEEMLNKLNTESRRFAKRQVTFTRRWKSAYKVQNSEEAFELVADFLK